MHIGKILQISNASVCNSTKLMLDNPALICSVLKAGL